MIKAALTLLSAGLIFIVAREFFGNSSSRQLERLTAMLEKIKNSPDNSSPAVKDLQNQIYALLHKELNQEDHKILYQTIDLLKLYLGEGMGQPDDPARITKIIYQAMRSNQTDVLSYTIHAFVPLMRKAPVERIAQIVEQLCIIAAVAMKNHKNFLTARAIEIILEGLERLERAFAKRQLADETEADFAETGAKAVKLVGLAILRGGDMALFREFCAKINEFISLNAAKSPAPLGESPGGDKLEIRATKVHAGLKPHINQAVFSGRPKDTLFAAMWPSVFAAWLNYLARKEREEAFSILLAHINLLTDNNKFDEKALEVLIGECRHMIVVSSLNPYNTFAAPMVSFFLNAAFKTKNAGLWRQAASCAQEALQTALARHGAKEAFPTLYPFLEIGRKILRENLKSGQEGEKSVFLQETLVTLAKEWMKITEYEARKSFVLTVPDIVLQIREYWLDYPAAEGSEKSLNKFCHFLIVYWMRLRPKIAARTPQPEGMDFRGLLTEEEIKKLEFLF